MSSENTSALNLSLTRNEISRPTVFRNSWLDAHLQLRLIQEITAKVQVATGNQLYVVYSTRLYPGAINRPFEITDEEPKWSSHRDVSGPFEPKLACAIAYLEQEATVLIASSMNFDLKLILKKAGITSIQAVGQGIALLAGQINAWHRSNPEMSIQELIDTKKAGQLINLEKEIEDHQERYQTGQRDFGYREDSTSFYIWKTAEDRLNGFKKALLLLAELQEYSWTV